MPGLRSTRVLGLTLAGKVLGKWEGGWHLIWNGTPWWIAGGWLRELLGTASIQSRTTETRP